MVDETGRNIGITELEAEENKENNSISFDDIEFANKKNDKIEVSEVTTEETSEDSTEDEVEEEIDIEENEEVEGEVEE